MRPHALRGSIFLQYVLAAAVAGMAAIALAQTSTQQSQSNSEKSSASASAAASSNGMALAAGSAVVTPVKGLVFLVQWKPNIGVQDGSRALALHEEYIKSVGAKAGVLSEGALAEDAGRLAIVQGSPNSIREFAANSPLIQARAATFEISPYNMTYSRIGVVADKAVEPGKAGATDGSVKTGATTNSGGSGGG